MAENEGWKSALNKLTGGPMALLGLIGQLNKGVDRTLSNPEEALGNAVEGMTPPIDDPQALSEWAANVNPQSGMGGMMAGKGAKGFKNLRQFSSLYDKMPRVEISDAEAKLTPAIMQRFERTKSLNLDDIDKMANDPSIPPEEIHALLSQFKGQYPSRALDVLVDHPKLYEQYPDLARMQVKFDYGHPKSRASYDPESETATLNLRAIENPDELLDSILHEMQHGIQEKEGLVGGSSPEFYKAAHESRPIQRAKHGRAPLPEGITQEQMRSEPVDLYRRTIGEIEARDTTARKGLTDEQRTSHMPYESQHVPIEQGIDPQNWLNAMYPASETDEILKRILGKLKGE